MQEWDLGAEGQTSDGDQIERECISVRTACGARLCKAETGVLLVIGEPRLVPFVLKYSHRNTWNSERMVLKGIEE